MRYIYPPAPTPVRLPSGQIMQTHSAEGATVDLVFDPEQFYRLVIEQDPKGFTSAKTMRMTLRIGENFLRNTSCITLDEEVWSHLKTIVEEPTGGYNPAIGKHMMPWIDAIVGARTSPDVLPAA